jgi:hypothetical protein
MIRIAFQRRFQHRDRGVGSDLASMFRPFGPLRADLCPYDDSFADHPQVGQREQRPDLRSVLRQSSVPRLHVVELLLQNPERMLALARMLALVFPSLSSSFPTGVLLSNARRLPGFIATCHLALMPRVSALDTLVAVVGKVVDLFAGFCRSKPAVDFGRVECHVCVQQP